jgi:hypothetical protein
MKAYLLLLIIQHALAVLNGSTFDLEGYLSTHEYVSYRPKTCDRYSDGLDGTSQWMWLPVRAGKLRPKDSRSFIFEGNCFKHIEIKIDKIQGYQVDIKIKASN